MNDFLIDETNRCLRCKKARCAIACPAHTSIPECIQLFKEGRYEEAGRILYQNNPFSIISSKVCDWSRLCFGHCVLNHKKVPVHWYEVEQFLSETYLKNYHPAAVTEEKSKKVAIIGAGPAGLSAAIWLREAGYQVTVFDDNKALGGVLRYGIPQFRLDQKYILEFERLLDEYGIGFRPEQKLGTNLHLSELRKQYDATLIAAGASLYRAMRIPGEKDNPRILYAIDYLKDPDAWTLGKKVLVIGGGNVTMDASRTAVRKGCDTTVYYRKSFENMPANASEVEDAQKDGVRFVLFRVPVEIKDENVAVMRLCENSVKEEGKIVTKTIEGSDIEVEFDNMIVAISENVDYSIFEDENIDMTEKGWPVTNGQQQTSLPDVFLAGDYILGPKTVVEAVASARIATEGIREYLEKETENE